MANYFRPWQRKFGVVTLLMACAFAAEWLRSRSVHDLFTASCPVLTIEFRSDRGWIQFELFANHSKEQRWALDLRSNPRGRYDVPSGAFPASIEMSKSVTGNDLGETISVYGVTGYCSYALLTLLSATCAAFLLLDLGIYLRAYLSSKRRVAGVGTLIVMLIFVAGWIRSMYFQELAQFVWGPTRLKMINADQRLLFQVHSNKPDYSPPPDIISESFWDARPRGKISIFKDSGPTGLLWRVFGVDLAIKPFGTETAVFESKVQFHYLSIIIPLAAFSLLLLLSGSRPRPDSIRSAITHSKSAQN